MTKADIVERIAYATGITRYDTEAVVDAFLRTVIDILAEGHHIEIRGFGTFKVKRRGPRMARNPRTGDEVPLEERFVPTFKVSREVRVLVDEKLKESGLDIESFEVADEDESSEQPAKKLKGKKQ